MTTSKYAVIADDLTGAGDSGVHFAASGKTTALLFDADALAPATSRHEIVAISSESRLLDPDRAAKAVAAAVVSCRKNGVERFYKKIDSTLRGNPGAEIEAALNASECAAALVCTAMPKTGRTVENGILLLNGRPIHESEMGRDPFTPVLVSDIGEIIASQTDLPVTKLPLRSIRRDVHALADNVAEMIAAGGRIILADATEDSDLRILANLFDVFDRKTDAEGLLPVGSGGLAEALAGPAMPYDGPEPEGRLLAVIGSLTETTLRQIEYAREQGIYLSLELDMTAALAEYESEMRRLLAEAEGAGERQLLLHNKNIPQLSGQGMRTEDGVRAAKIFASAARAICQAAGCERIYATGGSTAVAVAEEMGLGMVTLRMECMPGVVAGSCKAPGLPVRWFISKAGGFGGPDTLARLAGKNNSDRT